MDNKTTEEFRLLLQQQLDELVQEMFDQLVKILGAKSVGSETVSAKPREMPDG